jgi:hypothetical protein
MTNFVSFGSVLANTETKLVTSVKSNLWLPDDGPYEVRNMLECILEF